MVNTCAAYGDVASGIQCLIELIQTGACLTEDVVACVARRQTAEFAAAAESNPDDERSARAADTLSAFVRDRGYLFDVDPAREGGSRSAVPR
jgi:hypothetical protein